MERHLRIAFGAISPSLAEQLEIEGFDFNTETVEHLQKDLDAINRLRIRSVITGSESTKAYTRLNKAIITHIREQNNLQ